VTKDDIVWSHREGRDSSGDKFITEILIHGSGQILARVYWPLADEFNYRVAFYVYVPDTVLAKPGEMHDFVDVDSAKRFAETTMLKYDPVAPPGKAEAANKRKRKKADAE